MELMEGVDPMQDARDPKANSGEKGPLDLVIWPGFLSKLGIDTLLHYDALNLITALQGLVNRDAPRMLISYDGATDNFWYAYLRRPEKLFYGYKVNTVHNMEEFLQVYGEEIRRYGLILWDENVPATMNVALTACGVDGYLPVRKGGELEKLLTETWNVPVKADLSGMFTGKGTIPGTGRESTGSAKCDAYLWAMDQYMDRTSPRVMGYMLDGVKWGSYPKTYPDLGNAYLPNHDYMVSEKAFVFDLSPWADEAPNDDPDQELGTDYETMKMLFRRQYDRAEREIFTVCGFLPYQQKYTTYENRSKTHTEVDSEWRFVEILSSFNGIWDAEGWYYTSNSNCSAYQHYQSDREYVNSDPPADAADFDPTQTYGLIYMGDYDAAAWMKMRVPDLWRDAARGSLPLAWGFNPNLSEKIPMVFDYLYEYKTDNDFFVSGNSGAGYLNPTVLFDRKHSDLPPGDDAFIRHCRPYFEKYDLDMVGFVINGPFRFDERVRRMYTQFAPVGAIHNCPLDKLSVTDGGVFLPQRTDISNNLGMYPNVERAAQDILKTLRSNQVNRLNMYRFILWTPEKVQAVVDRVEEEMPGKIQFVDPYTFMSYAKQTWERTCGKAAG